MPPNRRLLNLYSPCLISTKISLPPHLYHTSILYFFGLRPCEIDEETHREGEFLITRNRKRKNGKIEHKKIPIPTQVQELIDWDKPLTADLHRLKSNDIMKENRRDLKIK